MVNPHISDHSATPDCVPIKNPEGLDVDKLKSIEELQKEGYKPFLLGAVYTYAEVTQRLPEMFAGTLRAMDTDKNMPEPRGAVFSFGFPLLTHCEQHNYLLDFMDSESYEYFKVWMQTQMFVNRKENKLYVLRRYPAPILDPFAFRRGVKQKAVIDCYTVSGVKALIRPICEQNPLELPKHYVQLRRDPPEESTIRTGKVVLEEIK